MRFLRNFTAVVLAVGVIIGLGMLWAHAYGGASTGPGASTGNGRPPPGVVVMRGHGKAAGLIQRHYAVGRGASAGRGNGRPPPGVVVMRGHGKAAGLIQAHSAGGFQVADVGNLIRTILIEAVLAAVVIAVSVSWRRHRRMRRMAASS
jgi:hypothetical protein